MPPDRPTPAHERLLGALRRVLGLGLAIAILLPAVPGVSAATTIEARVAASPDDAEESSRGKVTLTDAGLELTFDRNDQQVVGLRWSGLAIPDGATITAAYVQLAARESHSEATSLSIRAQAADHAPTFGTGTGNLSGRPLTTASVAWNPAPWTAGDAGASQRTPDLSTVIQEIVSRPGWTSGNALALIVTGTGHRTAWAYDGSSTAAPLLHVEFTVPPPDDPPVARLSVAQVPSPALTVLADASASTDTDATPIASYRFDFGDGTAAVTTTAPTATALHTYATAGTYTVTLTATDTGNNVSAPASASVTVNPPGGPTILERRIAASSDDAEESATGGVSLSSSDLELTFDGSQQVVGLRWSGLAVPGGATITAAYVQFVADASTSEATSLSIQGQAADHAASFTSNPGDISSRTRTAASVPWSPAAWTGGDAGASQRTSDLSAVIQEIVSRPGWTSGNALAIVITGTGQRTARSYDGSSAAAPLLHVEFNGGTVTVPPADQVHWTIIGQNAVTFDWRGGSDTLRYGPTPAYGKVALGLPPDPLPFSSAGPFREAKLTGLAENTTYHYAIGSGPDHTFRTPPPRGTPGFTIVAQGDIGAAKDWPRVAPIQSRIATLAPDFVLMLGDLTYGDDRGQASVDAHFNDMMVWSRDAAYMPVWGNHEWDSSGEDDLRNYKGRFDLPNAQGAVNSPAAGCCGEDWSWFDYGNARFISYPEPYSGAWADWATRAAPIMNAAQADPAIAYIVTFGHFPAYSSGYHAGQAGLQSLLAGLAAGRSKYVLNLNGHSHNYERSHPQSGVVHVTAGTGGSSLETDGTTCMWAGGCPPPAWSAYRAMRHVVLQLRFAAAGIEGTAYCGPAHAGKNDVDCIEGTVLDMFTVPNPTPPTLGVETGGPVGGRPKAWVAPAPATSSARLAFETTREGAARVEIFDLSGRRVATLLDEPRLRPGRHEVSLGPVGGRKGGPAAGLYLYRVTLAEGVLKGRFVMLR